MFKERKESQVGEGKIGGPHSLLCSAALQSAQVQSHLVLQTLSRTTSPQ